jgi:uncharacterized NAD(P)/FAD-binding protein YdhS
MLTFITSLIKRLCCPRKNIAIIGCGASGVAVFHHLIRNYQKENQKISITIFDKNNFRNKGIAYSTTNINHLLNVPAYRMGIVDDDRYDFVKWLKANDYDYYDHDFVPRSIYGLYLESIMELSKIIASQKGIKYQFINEEITEIKSKKKYFLIGKKSFNTCVLATGIELKNNPKNFWFDQIENYLNYNEVHILGSGLTSLDAITTLQDAGYKGTIFVHSRKGLMPIPHNATGSNHQKANSPLKSEDANLPLSQIFKKFKETCKNSPNWQDVFNSIRPITQELWKNFNVKKKEQFTRHCLRFWNVHRHRCPPIQYQKIEKLIHDKKLFFTTTKPPTKKIINCTGFDFSFSNILIKNLIKFGIVKYDDLNAGIISVKPNFYIVGAANFGSIFETTAIPEITTQSHQVAQEILEKLNRLEIN